MRTSSHLHGLRAQRTDSGDGGPRHRVGNIGPTMDRSPASPARRLGYTRRAAPLADQPPHSPERTAELTAQCQAIASAGPVDQWFHDDDTPDDRPLGTRPELMRLLDTLRSGDVIAVSSIDRIGADLQDLADILQHARRAGAVLEVGGARWDVDFPTLNLLVLHTVLLAEARAGRIGAEAPRPAPVAQTRRDTVDR